MIKYKSINHLNTSLEDREAYFHQIQEEAESASVFLQTCNRMELYYGEGDVPREVALHLFRVVCGLESAIVGERAVQGQVREAYYNARTKKKLPAEIHKLFECALEVGKRVRTETRISYGAVSYSLAAIEILKECDVDVRQAKIVVLGVNNLTSDILKFLNQKGAAHVVLVNRSIDNAHKIADELNVPVYGLEDKKSLLKDADAVISATSSDQLVVEQTDIEPNHKLYAIDLAFPRDIDPMIAQFPDVSLFNLQDVERMVQKNISVRKDEVAKAEAIIEEEITLLQTILERRKAALTTLNKEN